MNDIPSVIGAKNQLGRFLESTKSEIVGFAKDATLESH
jgi:hypothetical protein